MVNSSSGRKLAAKLLFLFNFMIYVLLNVYVYYTIIACTF